MKKNTIIILGIVMLLGSILIGCQTAAQRPMIPEQSPQQQTTDITMTESDRRDLANRLSRLAEEVDGVKKAVVIVSTVGVTQGDTTIDDTRTRAIGPGNAVTPGVMPDQPRNNINNPNIPGTVEQRTNMDNSDGGVIVMVGLTLNKKIDKAAETKRIKEAVVNKLKAGDKRISQVLVTTDPNLITRINDIANGIIQGRPIQTFERDINDIGRDLQVQQPAF